MSGKLLSSTSFILVLRLTAAGQCGFPATLTAAPNACLGSAIHVSSTHALTKIAWYRDGTLVATTLGTTQPGSLTESTDSIPFPGRLSTPQGLVVDDDGYIYFTTNIGPVIKWSPFSNTWTTIGNSGSSSGGCAVDKAGNVSMDSGESVLRIAPGASGGVVVAGGNGFGSGANQLESPLGLALDCEGNLYVADAENCRVQKWAPGATSGVTVAGGNGDGSASNQLSGPVAVALDGQGNIFVADQENNRIQKWAPGASSGITVAGGNGPGTALNQLTLPSMIFVDNNDNLYIFDFSPTSRLQRWAAGANTGTTVMSNPQYPQMAGAWAAFVDSRGNIYGGLSYGQRLLWITQPTTIDSTYQPTVGGRYWAVVTDINGYSTPTDTLVISPPPAGPPSIVVSAAATSLYLCQPDSFVATAANAGLDPTYQWQVSGVSAGGDSTTWSNNLFANGDQVYCILTTIGTSCEPIRDTSNIVTLSVDPQGHATVTIAASDSNVCDGTPITFTATVINGSTTPGFDWWVNGQSTGVNAPTFIDSTPGSQVVYCEITSDASCGLAKSNSIPVAIYPQPMIPPGQVFTISYGQSLTLEPVTTGDISSWLWTPGAGLSDSTIEDPVATPPATTGYTLQVSSPGGCQTKGLITVEVYTPLAMPNAFTPDGDGRNDRLYVLGGPTGSTVHLFEIFNRWGTRIYGAHDITPGDATRAWDGTIGGRPAPAGTYVYLVVMSLPGGRQEVYKGTVELIR